MGVIRSRPRIAQGLSSTLADGKADTQQVRRMVQAIPKPVDAPGSWPSGLIRMSAPFGQYNGPTSSIYGDGWSADSEPMGDPPNVTPHPSDSSKFVVGADGWYSFRLWAVVAFSSGAPLFVEAQFDYDGCVHQGLLVAPVFTGAGGGVAGSQVDLPHGPVLLTAGTAVYPSLRWDSSHVMTDTGYGLVVEVTG